MLAPSSPRRNCRRAQNFEVHVAVLGSGFGSKVTAGENRGETLPRNSWRSRFETHPLRPAALRKKSLCSRVFAAGARKSPMLAPGARRLGDAARRVRRHSSNRGMDLSSRNRPARHLSGEAPQSRLRPPRDAAMPAFALDANLRVETFARGWRHARRETPHPSPPCLVCLSFPAAPCCQSTPTASTSNSRRSPTACASKSAASISPNTFSATAPRGPIAIRSWRPTARRSRGISR